MNKEELNPLDEMAMQNWLTQDPDASSEWISSREDMDSFTTNPETGETEHVVYVYPPGEYQRIAIFGPNAREYANNIATAMTAVYAGKVERNSQIAITAIQAIFQQIVNSKDQEIAELKSKGAK